MCIYLCSMYSKEIGVYQIDYRVFWALRHVCFCMFFSSFLFPLTSSFSFSCGTVHTAPEHHKNLFFFFLTTLNQAPSPHIFFYKQPSNNSSEYLIPNPILQRLNLISTIPLNFNPPQPHIVKFSICSMSMWGSNTWDF